MGIGSPYTVGGAILGDAVSLVRGDRYMTTVSTLRTAVLFKTNNHLGLQTRTRHRLGLQRSSLGQADLRWLHVFQPGSNRLPRLGLFQLDLRHAAVLHIRRERHYVEQAEHRIAILLRRAQEDQPPGCHLVLCHRLGGSAGSKELYRRRVWISPNLYAQGSDRAGEAAG